MSAEAHASATASVKESAQPCQHGLERADSSQSSGSATATTKLVPYALTSRTPVFVTPRSLAAGVFRHRSATTTRLPSSARD